MANAIMGAMSTPRGGSAANAINSKENESSAKHTSRHDQLENQSIGGVGGDDDDNDLDDDTVIRNVMRMGESSAFDELAHSRSSASEMSPLTDRGKTMQLWLRRVENFGSTSPMTENSKKMHLVSSDVMVRQDICSLIQD